MNSGCYGIIFGVKELAFVLSVAGRGGDYADEVLPEFSSIIALVKSSFFSKIAGVVVSPELVVGAET